MEEKQLLAEDLTAMAQVLGHMAPPRHAQYRGKIEMALECSVTNFDDFGTWNTLGVAAPCKEVQADFSRDGTSGFALDCSP